MNNRRVNRSAIDGKSWMWLSESKENACSEEKLLAVVQGNDRFVSTMQMRRYAEK
jgi:hypothetical protein